MKIIKAYIPDCECSKTYRTKKACLNHEKGCYKNPSNKACITCDHQSVEGIFRCQNELVKNNELYGTGFFNGIKRNIRVNCPFWELRTWNLYDKED